MVNRMITIDTNKEILTVTEFYEMTSWCSENCKGNFRQFYYHIGSKKFIWEFELKEDAVLFELTWV